MSRETDTTLNEGESVQDAAGWRPIGEHDPERDTRFVLVYGDGAMRAAYLGPYGWEDGGSFQRLGFEPTHWTSLPPPPEKDQ